MPLSLVWILSHFFLDGKEIIHWEITSDPLSMAIVSLIRFDLEPESLQVVPARA